MNGGIKKKPDLSSLSPLEFLGSHANHKKLGDEWNELLPKSPRRNSTVNLKEKEKNSNSHKVG